MTTMIDKFFGIPHALVRQGQLKNLSEFAVKLYVALWHESERYCTRELTYTTTELIDLIGGSPNSHNKARAELIKAKLSLIERVGSDGFIFHLCNPETGKPWPLPPTEEIIYQKKIITGVSRSPSQARSHPSPKINNAGTSFHFGHNVTGFTSSTDNDSQIIKIPEWRDIG